MTRVDIELFLLVFFVTYLVVAILVNVARLASKSTSKRYRIAVIIFALLVAGMFTYSNLGRSAKDYYQIPTLSPDPSLSPASPSANPITD